MTTITMGISLHPDENKLCHLCPESSNVWKNLGSYFFCNPHTLLTVPWPSYVSSAVLLYRRVVVFSVDRINGIQ